VTRLVTPQSSSVDLRDIRVVKKVGGTIEDTELVDGVVLNQNVIASAGGPTRMEKAKIAIIQFQLSAPKPDVRAFRVFHLSVNNTSSDGQHRCDQ
jgi:T-complex protein 1 subunit delta